MIMAKLKEKGEALAEDLGENTLFIQHDVTDEKGWEKVVRQRKNLVQSIF